jgi:hypothetical protein
MDAIIAQDNELFFFSNTWFSPLLNDKNIKYLIFNMLQIFHHKIWYCLGRFITKSGVVWAILSQNLVQF